MSAESPIRRAYAPVGTFRKSGPGRTPIDRLDEAMGEVVGCWNRQIPCGRVRVMNQPRYEDLRELLYVFDAGEICRAIVWYGSQSWQRANRAWRTFDAWISIDVATAWVEREQEAREGREARRALPADTAALVAAIGSPPATSNEPPSTQERIAAFKKLPRAQRDDLLNRAALAVAPLLRGNRTVVLMQAILLHDQEHRNEPRIKSDPNEADSAPA